MNATQHRFLTPFLGLVCLLLSVLLISLTSGWGRAVRWDAAHRISPTDSKSPMAAASRQMPLAAYAPVWEQPLFMPDRQPIPLTTAQSLRLSLDNLELTGTVLTAPLQIALVRDRARGKDVRIRLHDDYQGWMLAMLEPRRAVFSQAGESAELILPAATKVIETGGTLAPEQAQGTTIISATSPPLAPSMVSLSDRSGSPLNPALTPPLASEDDAAARRAQLDALKATVTQRRHSTSAATGAH